MTKILTKVSNTAKTTNTQSEIIFRYFILLLPSTSLSEALIFEDHGENMLCKEIVLSVKKNSVHNMFSPRECVRNLDLRVQVYPEELCVSKQWVHIVLEASKSAGAKGDVPKICGFVHPLHPL